MNKRDIKNKTEMENFKKCLFNFYKKYSKMNDEDIQEIIERAEKDVDSKGYFTDEDIIKYLSNIYSIN